MARYQLDDPRLDAAMEELAERDTADWPEPDAEARAQLARLLKPLPQTSRPRVTAPKRNAA